MTINGVHIIADEGMTLRRKSDGWMCGGEIYLGYAYYLNGEKLDEPFLEKPEDYEEVEKIEEEDEVDV